MQVRSFRFGLAVLLSIALAAVLLTTETNAGAAPALRAKTADVVEMPEVEPQVFEQEASGAATEVFVAPDPSGPLNNPCSVFVLSLIHISEPTRPY